MVRIRQEQEEGGKRCDLADGPQAGAQKLGTYCVDAIIGLYFIVMKRCAFKKSFIMVDTGRRVSFPHFRLGSIRRHIFEPTTDALTQHFKFKSESQCLIVVQISALRVTNLKTTAANLKHFGPTKLCVVTPKLGQELSDSPPISLPENTSLQTGVKNLPKFLLYFNLYLTDNYIYFLFERVHVLCTDYILCFICNGCESHKGPSTQACQCHNFKQPP